MDADDLVLLHQGISSNSVEYAPIFPAIHGLNFACLLYDYTDTLTYMLSLYCVHDDWKILLALTQYATWKNGPGFEDDIFGLMTILSL